MGPQGHVAALAFVLLSLAAGDETQTTITTTVAVDCTGVAEAKPVTPHNVHMFGAMHDVVGPDGVYMLSLHRRPDRFNYSYRRLARAQVFATNFPAADAKCEKQEALSQGCIQSRDVNPHAEATCKAKFGWGIGCPTETDQAIAESHRRALVNAQQRSYNWTTILEDDAVPLNPLAWNKAFNDAWPHVPDWVRMIRLSWCNWWDHYQPEVYIDGGTFKLYRWLSDPNWPEKYQAGLCTGGYMVHKDALPDLLGLFPCCCGSDCCFAGNLFDVVIGPGNETWGSKYMLNLDILNSTNMTTGWGPGNQLGIIAQDNRRLGSIHMGTDKGFTLGVVDEDLGDIAGEASLLIKQLSGDLSTM